MLQTSPVDLAAWIQLVQTGGIIGVLILLTFGWLRGAIVRGKDLTKVEQQRDDAQAEVKRLRDKSEETLRELAPLLSQAVDVFERAPRAGPRRGGGT